MLMRLLTAISELDTVVFERKREVELCVMNCGKAIAMRIGNSETLREELLLPYATIYPETDQSAVSCLLKNGR